MGYARSCICQFVNDRRDAAFSANVTSQLWRYIVAHVLLSAQAVRVVVRDLITLPCRDFLDTFVQAKRSVDTRIDTPRRGSGSRTHYPRRRQFDKT